MTGTSVQTGERVGRSGGAKQLVFDSNVYEGFGGSPVFRWGGADYATIEAVRSGLGFEAMGTFT